MLEIAWNWRFLLRPFWVSLIASLLVAYGDCGAAEEDAGVNVLANPSFDEGVQENGVPAGWNLYGGLDEHRRVGVLDAPEGAGKALRIDDGDPEAETGVSQTVNIEPSTPYVARVRVCAVDGASMDGAYLQLRFLPGNEFVQRALTPGDMVVGRIAPRDATRATLYLYTHREPKPQLILDDASLCAVQELPRVLALEQNPAPESIEALKDLHIDTAIVSGGAPKASIVVPESGAYNALAEEIVRAVETVAGTRLEVVRDNTPQATVPLSGNVLVLGNRSTNKLIGALYDRYYTLLDLRYPGPEGYEVRSLHNPFGNGCNAILLGGSDAAGVAAAVHAFLAKLPVSSRDLSVGWLMDIQLGKEVAVPEDLKEVGTWEDSRGYGSAYFGWNSLSKRMALYYMTGDPAHAREFIRLAFPDEETKQELFRTDGERVENKDDPLAGPYHYNAHMLILYWDLIEESPVFSDDERLRVTQAFTRQFQHPGIRSAYLGPATSAAPPSVGSRHGQWAAIALYSLGRYFAKDYPDPLWPICEENGARHFASLHNDAWIVGENDNLYWYSTSIAPLITYLVLSGDRAPIDNGVLAGLLRGIEVLANGRTDDTALRYASLDLFNKSAYLTQDGRWGYYRGLTGVDVDMFRLGQSFWPEERLAPAPPTDLINRWTIHPLPESMWQARGSGLPLNESFKFMSYRSAPDASGDFLLVDGINQGGRNPYHTQALLDLRVAGTQLLQGHLNQLRTLADGLAEPTIPMDAALKYTGVLGKTATAVVATPGIPFADWRRTVVLRVGQYAVVADEVAVRADTENLEVQLKWENALGTWQAAPGTANRLELNGEAQCGVVVCAAPMTDLEAANNRATMTWTGPAHTGQKRLFLSLAVPVSKDAVSRIKGVPLGDTAAVFATPEPLLVVAGSYEGIEAALLVLSPDHLYAQGVTSVPLENVGPLLTSDAPVEIDWDFTTGNAEVRADAATHLVLAGNATAPMIVEDRRGFTGALLSPEQKAGLETYLRDRLERALAARSQEAPAVDAAAAPEWTPVMKQTFAAAITNLTTMPIDTGPVLCAAEGSAIHLLQSDGSEIRSFHTDGAIRMLRWWDTPKLLLAGCVDERLVAFDVSGERKWVFTSEMDPAVWRAAKDYWFKSALPGIYGLDTGVFFDGNEQAFLGSACTMEFVDTAGQLVRRMPQFWGPTINMILVPGPQDSLNLLCARSPTDWWNLGVINSAAPNPDARNYDAVPAGHTPVLAWGMMNHNRLFYDFFDASGEKKLMGDINGLWNRIVVWKLGGEAQYSASFGPGETDKAMDTRHMFIRGVDCADLDGDGIQEIAVATEGRILVMLTGACEKLWAKRLPSPPSVLKCVTDRNGAVWVVVGCEDGRLLAYDKNGILVRQGQITGVPACVQTFQGDNGEPFVAVGASSGNIQTLIADE